MKRIWVAIFLLVLPVSACSKAPPPAAAAPPATAEAPAPAPAQPSDAVCQFFPMLAAPRAEVTTLNGTVGVLGPGSCTYTVPEGSPLTLTVTIPAGKDPKGVTVTGTLVSGTWKDNVMTLKLEPRAGDEIVLTLDAALGQDRSSVYTFRAQPATTVVLSSGPAQTGPWTPIGPNGFIPSEHGWVRAEWSRPGLPRNGLFYNWPPELNDGDRVAIYRLDSQAPVHEVTPPVGMGEIHVQPAGRFLYWGASPAVQRVAVTGAVTKIADLNAVPTNLHYDGASLVYNDSAGWSTVDLTTGKTTAGAQPPAPPVYPKWMEYPSPDGQWIAVLTVPDPSPGTFVNRLDPADLVIREGAQELVRMPHWLDVTRQHPGCNRGDPGLGWRADGSAIAAISAPREGLLQLKVLDIVTKESRVLAEAAGSSYEAISSTVTWSPDSRYITFGARLVDAQTGRLITTGLPDNVLWSPDSRYLLTSQRHHPFTAWGKIGIVEAATGKRQELGQGQILGWTPQGAALIVRWDISAGIPVPGKDCD